MEPTEFCSVVFLRVARGGVNAGKNKYEWWIKARTPARVYPHHTKRFAQVVV
jgi:hypothetical protein